MEKGQTYMGSIAFENSMKYKNKVLGKIVLELTLRSFEAISGIYSPGS